MSEPEKTFTQDEVNAIIGERLKAERARIMRDVQAKEAELARRESMMTAKADWQRRGLPVELLEMLDAEKLDAAAEILEGRQKPGARAGFCGGKAPDHGSEPLTDADGKPTERAIRQRMGLTGKE